MTPEAVAHLRRRCPVMRRLIRVHGPCGLVPEKRRPPFQSLIHAVAHQQLHGRAAATILSRFCDLFAPARFPTAAQLATVSDETLRACGFSRGKIAALRDIAEKTLSGVVPTTRAISRLSDEEIITRLTAVRGVGRWTAEMLLIFQLGRPDVFPVDDFGIRNGLRAAFELPALPTAKEALPYRERWTPYSTTAAWYLWRAADAATLAKLRPKPAAKTAAASVQPAKRRGPSAKRGGQPVKRDKLSAKRGRPAPG